MTGKDWEKLENIGQVFGYVGVEQTEEDCFFDGSKSIKTSHLFHWIIHINCSHHYSLL